MSSLKEFRCEICGTVSENPIRWFVIECTDQKLAVIKWDLTAAPKSDRPALLWRSPRSGLYQPMVRICLRAAQAKFEGGPGPEKPHMIQRRLRIVKWLSATPALAVCTLCNREFNVPMSALRRTADAQATLQRQFDRHKCTGDVLLRQEPDEEDEEEDDHKKEDDDDDDDDDTTDDGYSE